mmetsp:Transcript_78389/g.217720  ORF Transcript_78389/g.217720 Transcript_78389/m.217720 type:complete len:213 (+) Transcript_78389:90-728(+)
MSLATDGRFSFAASHGGPGTRHGHNVTYEPKCAPPRARSLPGLGIPAGYSPSLGNGLGLHHYSDLRNAYEARLDIPPPMSPPRKPDVSATTRFLDVASQVPSRLRPETMPAAGMKLDRIRGKRLVPENTNTLSHVDTLLFGRDVDGSDGVLKQTSSSIYKGAAGLNQKAERTPIYGDLPPHCARTFGPSGTTTWDNPRGANRRLDPRHDYAS